MNWLCVKTVELHKKQEVEEEIDRCAHFRCGVRSSGEDGSGADSAPDHLRLTVCYVLCGVRSSGEDGSAMALRQPLTISD